MAAAVSRKSRMPFGLAPGQKRSKLIASYAAMIACVQGPDGHAVTLTVAHHKAEGPMFVFRDATAGVYEDFYTSAAGKDAKKIVVSHTRLFEEGEDKPSPAKGGSKKASGGGSGSSTSDAVKAINQNTEKSTLGDLDALAGLKEKMEKGK